MIELSVNQLNNSIKRQRLSKWTEKTQKTKKHQDPTIIMFIREDPANMYTNRLKENGWKNTPCKWQTSKG